MKHDNRLTCISSETNLLPQWIDQLGNKIKKATILCKTKVRWFSCIYIDEKEKECESLNLPLNALVKGSQCEIYERGENPRLVPFKSTKMILNLTTSTQKKSSTG